MCTDRRPWASDRARTPDGLPGPVRQDDRRAFLHFYETLEIRKSTELATKIWPGVQQDEAHQIGMLRDKLFRRAAAPWATCGAALIYRIETGCRFQPRTVSSTARFTIMPIRVKNNMHDRRHILIQKDITPKVSSIFSSKPGDPRDALRNTQIFIVHSRRVFKSSKKCGIADRTLPARILVKTSATLPQPSLGHQLAAGRVRRCPIVAPRPAATTPPKAMDFAES
jgi:hypothetical protein